MILKDIGPARRKSLMKHFKDIGKIKEASVTELCEADGITENVAEEIYRFFHEDTSKKMGMWYDKYIRCEMTPTSQQECRSILEWCGY